MFIAHYENTMRNARPKLTPVIVAPKVQAKPEPVPVVKPKAIAAGLPVTRENGAERRRAVKAMEESANASKRTHLADYRRIVGDMGDKPPVKDIIAAVSASHGLAVEDVIGKRKFKILVAARFDAINMVVEARPDLKTTQIARFFGVDHTSIDHAVQRRASK